MIKEAITLHPVLGLVIVSILVTLISTLAQKFMTDQTHLKNQKARQKEIQKELKGCKDPKKLSELNAELLGITGTMFKASMRPLMLTFIPFIIIFAWLRSVYAPIVDGVTVPLIKGSVGWLWYYIGTSIISSMIIRKMLDVA